MNRYDIYDAKMHVLLAEVVADNFYHAISLANLESIKTQGILTARNVHGFPRVEFKRKGIEFDYRKIMPGMVIRFTDENNAEPRIVNVLESNVNGFKWKIDAPCGYSFKGWKSLRTLEIMRPEPVLLNF